MERLLVCIDGSQYGVSCSRYAAWLSRSVRIDIEVVYVSDLRQFEVPFVADLSGSLGIQPFQAIMGQLQELEDKKAKVTLDEAEKRILEEGSPRSLKKTHKTGFLVDSLRELEESADFVILGKRGENANFATEHLGSTMERVARASSKPCFVASREFKPIVNILIAYDDAPSSRKAISFLKESRVFREAKIHLVTVSPKEKEEERLRALKDAESDLREGGYALTCQMLHGDTAPEVIEYANANSIDLVMMGAYGHTRIRRLIIGSFTTEMLAGCQLPCLLFR